MAQYEEITIDRGSDIAIQLELINADGSAKNLTDHTITAKLKKNYNSSDSTSATPDVWNFDSDRTNVGTNPLNGVAAISLSSAQTSQMKPGRYVYDVELSFVDSDGDTIVERILEGRATVTPSVTR